MVFPPPLSPPYAAIELKADYVKVLVRRAEAYEKKERLDDALLGVFLTLTRLLFSPVYRPSLSIDLSIFLSI